MTANGMEPAAADTRHLSVRRPLRRATLVVTLAAAVLATGACTHTSGPAWQDGAGPSAGAKASGSDATAAITQPVANATNVEPATNVVFTTEKAATTTVAVKDASGQQVPGATASDGRSWQPKNPLDWGKSYTATVTVADAQGRTSTATSSFTVMPQPAKLVRVSSFLGDGATVGVGMPMIVRFGRAIPQDARAAVLSRLSLTSTPAQEGAWAWYSPTEVHYRPKNFWQPYTKITYTASLAGVPMGDGWYGRSNLSVSLNIGRSLVMTVQNGTKQMTVTKDGKVIKTIPVSLGRPSLPSSSGTMVIMEKKEHTVFDTFAELGPKDGYRDNIDFAQRLTWGGEFIHAAPWSEGVQGKVNVSHGCVNVSEKLGQWLFGQTLIGDPVTVEGTPRKLRLGNGWTDWDVSWDQYQKGNAV